MLRNRLIAKSSHVPQYLCILQKISGLSWTLSFFTVALCCPLVLVISALQSSYLANGILCYVTRIFLVSRGCVKTLFLWPDSYVNLLELYVMSAIRPHAKHCLSAHSYKCKVCVWLFEAFLVLHNTLLHGCTFCCSRKI